MLFYTIYKYNYIVYMDSNIHPASLYNNMTLSSIYNPSINHPASIILQSNINKYKNKYIKYKIKYLNLLSIQK